MLDEPFDFRSRRWEPAAPAAATGRLTVAADWAPIRAFENLMCDRPEAVYGDLLDILQSSDLNLVNVEAVLGDSGTPIPKAGPHLRGPAKAVAALRAAPFHVACLANNHAMDFGPDGLHHTLAALADAGVATVGAGMERSQITRPILRQIKDTRVAIINCAEGESGRSLHGEPGVMGHDAAMVGQQIRRVKANGEADVAVVVFHGGREHVPVPPPYVVRQLRQIAEAGADAVVAHHPHVPQGIEIHRGVPIAYSLGNFAFWQDSPCAFHGIGYLLHLDLADSRLVGCEITPYLLRPNGLHQMPADMRDDFAAAMEAVTAPLCCDQKIRNVWSAVVAEHGSAPALDILTQCANRLEQNDDIARAAARLRNCFLTPAHSEFYIELMNQFMDPSAEPPPAWARRLVRRWSSSTITE